MATAEQLLHEAQYAFQSISFGESRDNRRNHRRAASLCRKIIRRYPVSVEAGEARAILRRLGEEAFIQQMPIVHQHASPAPVREAPPVRRFGNVPHPSPVPGAGDATVPLDWGGLWSLLSKAPKTIWGLAAFVIAILFEAFGFFVFVPLIALILLSGPFRGLLQPGQRRELNRVVIQANAWIDERLRSA